MNGLSEFEDAADREDVGFFAVAFKAGNIRADAETLSEVELAADAIGKAVNVSRCAAWSREQAAKQARRW